MPQHSLRFAVRDDSGNMTDLWKCWTSTGTGKRDVYLTSRPLGYAMKLSLHGSGQWHVGFDSNRRDQLFSPGELPASRFLGKWERPESRTAPVVLAARVHFPSTSLSTTRQEAPANTIWLPNAPSGYSTEVGIFLINIIGEVIDWPARNEGAHLLGRLPLEGGGQVCVVWRVSSTWPNVPSGQGSPKYFRGNSDADLAGANRAVFWGEEPDGSISFIEVPVAVHRASAT